MQIISKARVENDRLFDLYDYNILDSEEEAEFNEIALLITEICGTSISCVSFIDKDRHWLKAKVGFLPNEIERVCSFCNLTIENTIPNIVEDATLDERYSQNPFVINEPNIKFYAGFPLITPKGHCIGTISAVDPQVKKLSQTQIKSMILLAKQVINLLEIRLQKITIDKSEKKYETLLNNLNEGYFIDDLEGKIVFANNKLIDIFGLNQKDVSHFNIDDYVSEEYLEETKNRHNKRINGEDVANTFEYIGKKKNGDKIWIRANVSKVIEDGKIVGTQTILSDITKEKKLLNAVDESDKIISGYFNSTTDAVCLVDANLKVKTFNSVYAETIYNLKNITTHVNDYILDHISSSKKEAFLNHFNTCLKGNEARETLFMHYDKTSIWWDVKFIPLKSKDNKIIGVSYVAKDITFEKKLEIKNTNYNNLLEGINLINGLLLNFDTTKNINHSICDMLVNICGFNMAWIGRLNEETKQVETIAVYGDKHNFIKKNKIFFKEGEDGKWPISTSLKLNQTQVINDALKNAQLHALQEFRNETDWKSSISVPIIISNTNRAVLVVYSETENFFGHKEILSLESIVSNYIIAYERNELKKNLLEREYFINSIADNTPTLLSYWDQNLICKYSNSNTITWVGSSTTLMLNKHFTVIFGKDFYKKNQTNIVNVLKGNKIEFESCLLQKDGSEKYIDIKYIPHIVAEETKGFFALGYDITELKKQQIQLKFDANILHNIHDAILISDLNENLIYYNSIAEDIFGYSQKEVLGKRALFLKHIEGDNNENLLFEEILKGKSSNNVWKAVTKKSATIWLKINSSPYYNETNELIGVIGTCIDITEQKNAEENLKKTKELLESTNKAAGIGNWEFNIITKEVVWTDEVFEIFELEKLPINKTFDAFSNVVHPDDVLNLNEKIAISINKFVEYKVDYRIIVNKKIKYISAFGIPYKDDNNNVIGLKGIIQDITESKLKDEELKKSESNLKTTLENTDTAFILFDANFIVQSYNKLAKELTENILTSKIVEGNYGLNCFPIKRQASIQKYFNDALAGKTTNYEINYEKDGVEIYFSGRFFPVKVGDKVTVVIMALTDITERKKNELELQKTKGLLESTNAVAKIGNWDINIVKNEFIWTNENYVMFGLQNMSKDELQATYKKNTIAKERDDLDILRKRAIETGKGFVYEFQYTMQDGTKKIFETCGERYNDNEGKLIGIRGVNQDITDRKTNELELQKTKELLESINSIAKIGSWDYNLVTKELNWTIETYKIFEIDQFFPKEQLYNECITKIHPDDKVLLLKEIENAKKNDFFRYEHRLLLTENRIKYVLVIAKVTKNKQGIITRLKGSCQDITEQKIVEQNLENTKLELNAILDNVPFSIFMKNLKGEYLFTNKAFKERTNTNSNTIISQNEIFSEKETIKINASDEEIIKNKTNTFNNIIINGKELFTIKFPVLNNKNKLIAIGGVAIDITDKLNQEKLIDELNNKYIKELEQKQIVKIQSLLEGQEQERQRISRELHDGIGQTLSLCKLYASSLSEFKGSDDEKQKRIIDVNNSIKQAIAEVRTISSNLMPSELNDYGLIVSLASLCKKINTSGNIKISFTTNISKRLTNNLEIGIFRIIQEIINNTLKHAFATELSISIEIFNTNLLVQTKDNGDGFDTKKINRGNGLNNIKQRTDSLFGELELISQPKKGCAFFITIPIS